MTISKPTSKTGKFRFRLSREEIESALVLTAAAIVLPFLPDRHIDPWNVFNPYRIWMIVVAIMAIHALGYVGLRTLGAKHGLMLAGLLGGLISSAATHAAMAHRSKSTRQSTPAAAASLSSVVTALMLLAAVTIVDIDLGRRLLVPYLAATAIGIVYSLALVRRSMAERDIHIGKPVNLRTAVLFGAMLSGVLIGSTLLSRWLGPNAAIAATALAGFGDTHSSAVSGAMLGHRGVLTATQVELAILLTFTTNAVTKLVLSFTVGSRRFALQVAAGLIASVAAAWIVWGFHIAAE